jgi:hypothetical protein
MAENKCKWLWKNKNEFCFQRCNKEYCAKHNQQIKNGSPGMVMCIKCQCGVQGKTRLCAECGGKRFREFVKYYRRKYGIVYDEYDFITGNYKKHQLNS